MKKWIMFLSYPGIGILLFITGIEIFRRKEPLDFWLRFWSVTVSLTFLLIFVPLGLVSVLLLPRIPVHSAWVGIIGGLELLYLYLSGVLICHRQLVMWERFARTPG
mgnify:CR=1 FL=1